MDAQFWNQRYQEDGFAYGTEPNVFLKSNAKLLPPKARILCLAEGEGRNAIYLAEQQHQVTAIDYAAEGLSKLQQLAAERKLHIETVCADLADYRLQAGAWDAIVCIFGHFPSDVRRHVFSQLHAALKPGGIFIMEAYAKDQLQYNTGGPKTEALLYSTEDLKTDLAGFSKLNIHTGQKELSEGSYHRGLSSVIDVIAVKDTTSA